MGGALLLGRILHAVAISQEPEPIKLRVVAMALTFTSLVAGALANLALSV